MVAPNGAHKTTDDHPALPVTAEQLAREAVLCAQNGASAIHLHVRDGQQRHVLDADLYRRAVAAIKDELGSKIAIQITTEAVGRFTAQEQMACVRAVKPQAVSVAVKEIVPVDAGETGENEARAFFVWMKEQRIAPQFILYDAGDVQRFFELREKGVFPFQTPFLLFVLGRYTTGQQSDPHDLDPFVTALEGREAIWAMCAFGHREAECAAYAASLGGHVRIGFENNLYLPDGTVAGRNAELIAATAARLLADGFVAMDGQGALDLLNNSLR